MAQVEPMDVDAIESDFDNKENAFQYNNVLSRTSCTEKGYEELDVSELNMKLRYSVTPAASPMSKSLTGPCLDNRNCNSEDYLNNAVGIDNGNLTRSLNSTLTKTEGLSKSKVLPLQTLSTEPFVDSNQNSSIRRLLDQTDNNVIISVNNANYLDDNLSLPSPCSSVPDTPEATTPTKEIPKSEGSPIMRGLKSVLSMFRPSQSPIPPADDMSAKQEVLSPVEVNNSEVGTVQVSTPVADSTQRDPNSSKRSSPLKESLVFNDDLERELLWKEETTIIFKDERIPVHKLFLQNPVTTVSTVPKPLNTTVEHMDISCDESIVLDNSNTNINIGDQYVKNEQVVAIESDNEFLDCETTFTKNESNESDNKIMEMSNEVQVEGNVTVDISNKAEISNEITAEGQVLKNAVCVTPADTNILKNEPNVSAADVSPKMSIKNNTNIIEATVNFLSSESIDYSKMGTVYNVDLKQESQVNKESQLDDPNKTVSFNKQVIEDNGPIIAAEAQFLANLNMENDKALSNDLNSEKIEESKQKACCDIEKQTENCVNNIENYTARSSESSLTIDAKENIDDMSVTVKNIVSNSPASESRTIKLEKNAVFGDEPNIDKANMSNAIESLQYLEIKSNASLSITNEETKVAHNNDIPINCDNLSFVHNSDIVDSILDENHSIIKDDTTKDEIVKHILKENDDLPATQESEVEHNKSIDNIISPSLEDLINPLPAVQLEVSNTNINVDVNLEINETNNTEKANNSNMTDIVESKKESFPLQKNCENNVELKVDFAVNNVSHNDREVHEAQTGNDTEIFTSPSEIPLPDEDDIEQNILEMNSMCNSNFNKQDIAAFKICELDPNMDDESEMVVDDTKCDQSKITSNLIEENDGIFVNPIIENSNETTSSKAPLSKETNDTQACITQSDHVSMIETGTVVVKSENMDHVNTNFDMQIGENVVPDEKINKEKTSSPQKINEIVEQVSLIPQLSENMLNKIVEDKVREKISPIVEAVALNTEIYGDSLDKSECTNKVDGNQKDFSSEKGVDEVDEEIITSANNSPYVSVTDLDKVVEKIPNETTEEIDVPVATNTTFACSPPVSPKIISKGYNFNFDDIDDPFATKTKIRMSPTPDTPNQSLTNITKEIKTIQEVPKKVNRRKSQPERKRPIQKKNVNSTLSNKLNTEECISEKQINSTIISARENVADNVSTSHVNDNISECKPEDHVTTDAKYVNMSQKVDDDTKAVTSITDQISSSKEVSKEEIESRDLEFKNIEQTLVISTEKSTSSSEQYYSLGTSSGESSTVMNRSKNVFNLPEIDDVNFNPFATKSKMRMSPPPAEKTESSLESKNNVSNTSFVIKQQPDCNSTIIRDPELTFDLKIGNDSLSDTNNTTLSSKNTHDIDNTVKEIPTEDEDTVEGPFLELDDSKDNQKMTVDIETDMMNFEEIPQQEKDENLENGELFIDADAFEFLLNQNKSTTVLDSGKESLFLKFDPLFAKRVSSDGILAALSKVQSRQSTPKKVTKPKQQDFIPVEKSMPGPSNIKNCGPIEEYNEDLLSNVTKPMMVVNPAVSSITQKKPVTPKLNRRSLTFTSPAMAVIDRLLSLSGNSSHLAHDASIPLTGREQSETDLAITQLRELLAEKEINVHTLRSESKELKERLAALEVQVRSLETESAERLAKINELTERLSEKTKINKSMAIVVEEYERTIASLIAETEQDKKRNAEERMKLIKERDEQTAHLTSMEVSFSDLHSKYEKSKQIILSYKANEDIYKKSIKEFQDNLTKMQNNYELLKQHATSKLNHANQELEKMNRAHEAEVLKMNAMIKRKELHITSLEETLTQKTKANEELTAICDELINKVG